MAKKTFRIKDKQGNDVDYVIPASRVALDSNTDLDEKIGDIEDGIDEIDGSAVKKVTFNGGTPETPDEHGNVSLNQAKADWTERNSNSPKFIEHKPDIVEDVFYEEQTRTFKKNKNGTVSEIMTLPEPGSQVEVDDELGNSDNPIANRAVNAAVNSMQTAINTLQGALNTLIGSGNVQGAIDTFNEVTAFLNGIDTSDPTLKNQLLALSNAITALQTALNSKANSADVVKSVSVNGGTPVQPVNGNVNIVVPAGEKGDKGDTGNVEFEDLADLVALLVNDLTTGGAGNFLSAEMGKRLKQKVDEVEANIQRLYNNLGNIAFWDATAKAAAAPIPIDWGNPKHNVTLDLSLTNAVVTNNGVAVTNGSVIQVEEFGKLTLIVEPSSSSYELSSVTSSTTGAVVTDLLNGTYKVEITMGNSDVTLAITASATMPPAQVTLNVSNSANALGISNATAPIGGTFVGQISVVDDYFDGASIVSVKDGSNNDVPYTFSNNTITIANVPGDLTITAKATKQLKFYAGKGTTGGGGVSEQTGSCISDYIRLDGLNASSVLHWQHMFPKGTTTTAQTQVIFFYSSDKKLLYFTESSDAGWNPRRATNNQMQQNYYRDISTEILTGVLQLAGNNTPVYARSALLLTNGIPDSGIELTQGNKNFLDGITFVEADDLVVHSITYNGNGASCRSAAAAASGIIYRPNAIHGENFETLITVNSGLTLQSVVVTMGGVNISNDHPEWLTNKKIVIDSVTGDLDITLTAS